MTRRVRLPRALEHGGGATVRALARLVLCSALFAPAACMRAGGPATATRGEATPADSITVALWRFDETGGTRVPESGRFGFEGAAGLETRTGFGRFGGARSFTQSLDSFIFVPFAPGLDFGEGPFTIESWVFMNDYGVYEATPIVARWARVPNEQSWFFGIAGYRRTKPASPHISPGHLNDVAGVSRPGNVIFAFQPRDAGVLRTFASSRSIEIGRWTHVAVTYDLEVLRLWVDGQMDVQFTEGGIVRPSSAPILVGNFFDPRWLGSFGGDLRVEQALDPVPYYAFDGLIDELRLSNAARGAFSQAGWGR